MIVDRNYTIKWGGKNKQHLVSRGYKFTKLGDEVEVNVYDLMPNSKCDIEVICDNCGEHVFWHNERAQLFAKHYCKNKACKSKIVLENYKLKTGYDSPSKNPEVIQKRHKTCQEHYGVDEYMKSEHARETVFSKESIARRVEKSKQTCLERYGVENVLQSEDFKNRIKQTNLDRYGAENVFASEHGKNKIKQTNLERYGVEVSSKAEQTKEKARKTCLERFGVDAPAKSKEIRAKTVQTMLSRSHGSNVNTSKVQEDVWLAIGGELNYKIPSTNYRIDIAFVEDKLCIEIDGAGHFALSAIRDKEKAEQNEIVRENKILSLGWKLLRVEISDISDEKIARIKSAKEELLNSNRNKLILRLDNVRA